MWKFWFAALVSIPVLATAYAELVIPGRTYRFCSDRCRRHFEEHPGWYVPVKQDL